MQLVRSRDMQKESEGFLSRTLRPPSVWWPSGSSLPSSASAALSHGLASMRRLTPAGSANKGPGRKSETGRGRPGELPPPSLPQVAAPLPPSPSPLSAGHPILRPWPWGTGGSCSVHLWWPHHALLDFLPVPSLVLNSLCVWCSELLLLSCLDPK